MSDLFVLSSLLAGMVLAIQAAANVQLTKALRNPFAAASLQLLVGTAALLAVTIGTGTFGAVLHLGTVTPWHLLGGLGSALFVTAGIILVPRLGATGALGVFIAGQLAASAALDRFGLLGVQQRSPSAVELVGLIAVVISTAVIVRAGWNASSTFSPQLIALGVAAGAGLPIQGAVNAQLRLDLHAPFAVALVSFAVAAMTMFAVAVVTRPIAPAPNLTPAAFASIPWWGWLGGVMGASYVTAVFTAIPVIGAAAVVGLTIAGQQIAAILADQYAWFRLPHRPATVARLGGVAGLISGAVLVQLVR